MRDLIYREDVIKCLQENGWLDDTNIDELIETIPTAYDVDKVVDELESFAKLAEDRWVNGTSNYAYQEHKCWVKSIEIVKQSGVSDYVCDWKSDYGFVSDKYKRETGCGYTFYDLHHAVPFNYCPYCGKKIKVVE